MAISSGMSRCYAALEKTEKENKTNAYTRGAKACAICLFNAKRTVFFFIIYLFLFYFFGGTYGQW
jgi:hypothetical protein